MCPWHRVLCQSGEVVASKRDVVEALPNGSWLLNLTTLCGRVEVPAAARSHGR